MRGKFAWWLGCLPAMLLGAGVLRAETEGCQCNPADPNAAKARECSLTLSVAAMAANHASAPGSTTGLTTQGQSKAPQATEQSFPLSLLVPDASPRKPNRTLAVPARIKANGIQTLEDLTPQERLHLWQQAIAHARARWGDQWGLAYNGVRVRTQCHLHVHAGKLLPQVSSPNSYLVDGPEQIPVPRDGSGFWVQPEGRRLRIHPGEQVTETVLQR